MIYKNIVKKIFIIGALLFSLSNVCSSDSIFSDTGELPYCDNNECGYQAGVKRIEPLINNVETNQTLSEYIQSVVVYILTFISIVAVIYVLYAGFRIMVGGGSDETLKNSRKTILHVIIGILIIWLAYSIVSFIIDILYSASESK